MRTLGFYVSFHERLTKWRTGISEFLAYKSLCSLIFGIILIVGVLVYSLIIGEWPFQYWNNWPLNHGPWRYTFFLYDSPRYKLRIGLECAFLLLTFSVKVSFIATLIKFSKLTIATYAGSFITFWLAMYYLYWLID